MLKKRLLLSVIGLAFGFAGCNSFSTPSGVIATAYTAVKKGDLRLLQKTLMDDAAKEYGNEEGMTFLRLKFDEAKVSVSETRLISFERDHWGRTESRIFESTIAADGAAIGTAMVFCDVRYISNPSNPSCPAPGIPCHNQPNYDTEVQDCWITDLNF